MRPAAIIALAALALAAPASATPVFTDAPVACGLALPYKDCRASFDGWTLTVAYRNPEGRNSVAVYRKCSAWREMIYCADGEWRTGDVTGPLPGRGMGLRDGKPFPD